MPSKSNKRGSSKQQAQRRRFKKNIAKAKKIYRKGGISWQSAVKRSFAK